VAFSQRQVQQLLAPINGKRVLRDGKGQAHVAQHDVTAHLNRIFGFAGWDKEILHEELVFEQERNTNGKPAGRWDVCYRVRIRLIVRDADGVEQTRKDEGSVGTAQNQTRADAHKLAYTSAISLALKRAAKDLGDQFGLSLYNKGQLSSLVKSTLVGLDEQPADVQADVEDIVAMGDDEHEPDPVALARDELRDYCDGKHNLKAVALAFFAKYGFQLNQADADAVTSFTNLLKQGLVAV
jgi:hypothetical protein